jgi:hypothetical protein
MAADEAADEGEASASQPDAVRPEENEGGPADGSTDPRASRSDGGRVAMLVGVTRKLLDGRTWR